MKQLLWGESSGEVGSGFSFQRIVKAKQKSWGQLVSKEFSNWILKNFLLIFAFTNQPWTILSPWLTKSGQLGFPSLGEANLELVAEGILSSSKLSCCCCSPTRRLLPRLETFTRVQSTLSNHSNPLELLSNLFAADDKLFLFCRKHSRTILVKIVFSQITPRNSTDDRKKGIVHKLINSCHTFSLFIVHCSLWFDEGKWF